MRNISAIASEFTNGEPIFSIEECGSGNINDTFLVKYGPSGEKKFILQKINGHVYPEPRFIIDNMQVVNSHLHSLPSPSTSERFEIPEVLVTQNRNGFVVASDSSFWRAITYIENSFTVEQITDHESALEAGRALGLFQKMISNVDVTKLKDTLPGFHVTPLYLQRFDTALGNYSDRLSGDEQFCATFLEERREFIPVLENALAAAVLRLRPIHGDPKISNILFDRESKRAVSMIDLDTMKPGLIHYDLGDCLRSCGNPLGEDGEVSAIYFDLDLCRAILTGYLTVAKSFLTKADFDYIPASIRLLPIELGMRFFTDHLNGDHYFKVKYRGHNLYRAQVQFRLAADIERKFDQIKAMVVAYTSS